MGKDVGNPDCAKSPPLSRESNRYGNINDLLMSRKPTAPPEPQPLCITLPRKRQLVRSEESHLIPPPPSSWGGPRRRARPPPRGRRGPPGDNHHLPYLPGHPAESTMTSLTSSRRKGTRIETPSPDRELTHSSAPHPPSEHPRSGHDRNTLLHEEQRYPLPSSPPKDTHGSI